MTGKDFEDELLELLRKYVDERGVVMRRRQEFRMRGGDFQADQYVDFMVDSPDSELYLGVEAKKATASSSPAFYFSNYFPVEQIKSQFEYGERSGRTMYTIVMVRDYDGEDVMVLYPLEYFYSLAVEEGEKSVGWDELVDAGIVVGDTISKEDFDAADALINE